MHKHNIELTQENDYTKENLKEDIKSATRRTYIEAAQVNHSSLSEVKKAVRQKEKDYDVKAVIEKLLTNETLEPRIEELGKAMYEELKEKYPFLKGIVVMGSGAHGGA
jgi:phosphatidylserine/phosphatidylglycerophosphate/cardiolipin synthase-like enzyme